MFIQYQANHKKQRQISKDFTTVCCANFQNCAVCIDRLLVWIEKPSEHNANDSGGGKKKFYCERENKFGLNCQAVSDARGRILDISINYGGATVYCHAFEASELHNHLELGL